MFDQPNRSTSASIYDNHTLVGSDRLLLNGESQQHMLRIKRILAWPEMSRSLQITR
jgi:hypothetical protein